ncbi:MAG: hypothetical protein Q4B17_05125 [Lautropia sp.]|nr:hypothetical protein [Lautropia sp.]
MNKKKVGTYLPKRPHMTSIFVSIHDFNATTAQPLGRQESRGLQTDRAGPFCTRFLPLGTGHGAANRARTVLGGADFRLRDSCRPSAWCDACQSADLLLNL